MMHKLILGWQRLRQIMPALDLMIFAYLLLPTLVLFGFGIYFIFQQGYMLHFLGLLAALSLLMTGLIWIAKHRAQRLAETEQETLAEAFVQPSGTWGEHDYAVWAQLKENIEQRLEEQADWDALKAHALDLIAMTASSYGKREWAFSVPELLKVTEEVSRRYRKVLIEHVPGVEHLPCSWIYQGYEQQERIGAGYQWLRRAWDVYRAVRVTTPAGLLSELRGQLMANVFDKVSDQLSYKLKQALLQDVVAVAIDLYGGHLRLDDEALPLHAAERADANAAALELEPLRVCLIGQVSAGKSSIINALRQDLDKVAETNLLPTTDQATVYEFIVDGLQVLNLVDLPGLDGDDKRTQALLEQATQAHIVLWVLRADQPAKELDKQFKARFEAFYADKKHAKQRKPALVYVLNQVDKLKPVAEWQPPYALETDTGAKATIIKEALAYNQKTLDLPELLPLSVSSEREHYNVTALEQALDQHIKAGIQVQLNLRHLAAKDGLHLGKHLQRLLNTGVSLFKLSYRE